MPGPNTELAQIAIDHLAGDPAPLSEPIIELDGRSVDFWSDAVRLSHQQGRLDPAVADALNRLADWAWDIRARPTVRRWNLNLSDLDRFVAEHDRIPRRNSRLPKGAISVEETRLHNWVRSQRRHRHGLCPYQVERLWQVPHFSWDPLEDAWDRNVDNYLAFTNTSRRHPSMAAPAGSSERQLGVWAANQRAAEKVLILPHHRIVQLDELPYWFWTQIPGDVIIWPAR